ncbi:MAG: hypothetical protein U0M15_02140 [Bacillota bacterium]|nr:hypothetical protein [Bacillota bacterium]
MERIPNCFAVTEKQGQKDPTNRYVRVHMKVFCHGTDPLSFDKEHPHTHFVETKEDKS